ncbi:fimbrial protein [Providencia alcalifaciens]|nr:fimbrial protein [Providencia alcalifaciens]MTC15866.1 fimbrial protein [Providencia alcalifaciens]MTC29128.1 fimbrial protein [Providencia alcalifaciens]MTC49968.1 fimbrial protein [Providencia alcalifaciens]MTC62907.1 fimbrial protein [Providencia alcalifaciens]
MMVTQQKFNKCFLGLLLPAVLLPNISLADESATIYFSGTVANATCEFAADSDQEVIFDEPFSSSVLNALQPGEESDYRKSFMVEYSCEGISDDAESIDIIITPVSSTQIKNNVLYEDDDINVGFLLMNCGDDNGACEEVIFSGDEATVESGTGEHYFEVVAAKIDNQTITSGDIDAAIELSLQIP